MWFLGKQPTIGLSMTAQAARNTVWLTVASVLQKGIAFLFFLVVARFLPKEGAAGPYFLVLSLITLVMVIADLGVVSVVIRDVAKTEQREEIKRMVRSAIGLRFVSSAVAAMTAVVLAYLWGFSPQVILLTLCCFGIIFADAFSVLLYGVLRGRHVLTFEAIGLVIGQICATVLGVTLLFMGEPTPLDLIIALTVGSVWNAAFSVYWVCRVGSGEWLIPLFDRRLWWSLLVTAFPFALAAIFVKLSSSVDTFFIARFFDETAVAVYSVAMKFTYAFQFLPLAFIATLYPQLSRLVETDKEEAKTVFLNAMRYMAILAAPIAIGVSVCASDLIRLTGTQYNDSIQLLRILALSIIPLFLDFPIGSLLHAGNAQHKKTLFFGVALAVTLIGNALLLPWLGVVGAAITAVVSFLTLFFCGLFTVSHVLPSVRVKEILAILVVPLLSASAMGAIVWVVREAIGFAFSVGLGAAFYTSLLFLTKAIRRHEVEQIWRSIRRST